MSAKSLFATTVLSVLSTVASVAQQPKPPAQTKKPLIEHQGPVFVFGGSLDKPTAHAVYPRRATQYDRNHADVTQPGIRKIPSALVIGGTMRLYDTPKTPQKPAGHTPR